MEKLTKSLLVMAIILMANLDISQGGRTIPIEEDEDFNGAKGLLPFPPLWWLKIWWITHGWLKPFPPFGGIGPFAEVEKLKHIVDHLGATYTFRTADAPRVNAEAEDGD